MSARYSFPLPVGRGWFHSSRTGKHLVPRHQVEPNKTKHTLAHGEMKKKESKKNAPGTTHNEGGTAWNTTTTKWNTAGWVLQRQRFFDRYRRSCGKSQITPLEKYVKRSGLTGGDKEVEKVLFLAAPQSVWKTALMCHSNGILYSLCAIS